MLEEVWGGDVGWDRGYETKSVHMYVGGSAE